jgi:hypothetical protein
MTDVENSKPMVDGAAGSNTTPKKCNKFRWAMVTIGILGAIAGISYGIYVAVENSSFTSTSYSSVTVTSGGVAGCPKGDTMVLTSTSNATGTFCCKPGEDVDAGECTKISSSSSYNSNTVFTNTKSISSGKFSIDFTDNWMNLDNFPSTADADTVTSGTIPISTGCEATKSVTCTDTCDTCVTQLNSGSGVVDFECKYMADKMNHCFDINDGQCTLVFGGSSSGDFQLVQVSKDAFTLISGDGVGSPTLQPALNVNFLSLLWHGTWTMLLLATSLGPILRHGYPVD